jgi:hypothetical protein
MGLLSGLPVTGALELAGLADLGFSSYFDYDSLTFSDDSIPYFQEIG